MEKRIIGHGLLFGAGGGFLAFIFSWIFLEPVIGRAIDYESGRDAAQQALDHPGQAMAGMDMGTEVFSRTVQSTVGLATGVVLFGIAMGSLFSVAYVFASRRTNLNARVLGPLVAAGLFLVIYLVPFLKYPANPPSIGHGESIGSRTALWLAMVGCSALAMVAAVALERRIAARHGTWTATLLAAGVFAVVIGAVMALLPSLGHLAVNVAAYGNHATETPLPLTDSSGKIVFPGFPADDLYAFRLYSIGAQVILWAVIGLGFGSLGPTQFRPKPHPA